MKKLSLRQPCSYFVYLLFIKTVVSSISPLFSETKIFPKDLQMPVERAVSRDSVRQLCDYVLDGSQEEQFYGHKPYLQAEKVRAGDIIFVQLSLLELFFDAYFPEIHVPFVLITHNHDFPAPGKFATYLDDPRLIAWFSQNPDGYAHPKFIPMPIGLASEKYPHGSKQTIKKIMKLKSRLSKKHLAYLNIDQNTYLTERSFVQDLFARQPFVFSASRKPYNQYLTDIAKSWFVISPRGNGLDCHRHWEALLMGSYPIIKHSPLDHFFAHLPVLLIDDWHEVTPALLEKTMNAFDQRQFNFEILFIDYWRDLVFKMRDNFMKTYSNTTGMSY